MLASVLVINCQAGIAQLVERPSSSPRCGKGFFCQSQLSVQTVLLRCPYIPRLRSHATALVRTLKTPSTGVHTIVWTHES